MSEGESSPPYEPSHPATASMSTPNAQRISFAICRLLFAFPPGTTDMAVAIITWRSLESVLAEPTSACDLLRKDASNDAIEQDNVDFDRRCSAANSPIGPGMKTERRSAS